MAHQLTKGQFAGLYVEDVPTWYLDYLIKHWQNDAVVVKAAEMELTWRRYLGQRPGSSEKPQP